MEINPYAPPEANLAHETEEERIRKAHLATEANIRSAGGLYLFVSVLVGIAGLMRMLTWKPNTLMDWGITILQFFMGATFALTGYWLRQFKSSARVYPQHYFPFSHSPSFPWARSLASTPFTTSTINAAG